MDSATSAAKFSWTYSATTGLLATQTWPTGYQAAYTYTAQGYINSVIGGGTGGHSESKLEVLAVNARGQVSKYMQGGVITTVKDFNASTGAVHGIVATKSGQTTGNILKHSYSYDALGNLITRGDASAGMNVQEQYAYDNVNRLTQYTVMGGSVSPPSTVQMLYDSRGNLTYKSDVGTYKYDSLRPNRLASVALATPSSAQIANTGTRVLTYTYDDGLSGAQSVNGTTVGNGNLTLLVSRDSVNSRNIYTRQSYTSFNQPSLIERGPMNGSTAGAPTSSLAFVYGPEHQRIKQQVAGGADAGTTWYLNGEDSQALGYEKTVKASGLTEHRHYLSAAGLTFAIYTTRSGTLGSLAAQQVSYLHEDHLGSVAAVSSASGALLERLAYDPWGKRRNTNGLPDLLDALKGTQTNRGYTLHEHLGEVGLIHMNGRVYDPYTGRMMTADPYVPDPLNLQSFNRYAYVTNNPLSYTDPSGFVYELPPITIIGCGSCSDPWHWGWGGFWDGWGWPGYGGGGLGGAPGGDSGGSPDAALPGSSTSFLNNTGGTTPIPLSKVGSESSVRSEASEISQALNEISAFATESYAYVGNALAEGLVPGYASWQSYTAALSRGNYGQAVAYGTASIAEGVFFAMTAGIGQSAISALRGVLAEVKYAAKGVATIDTATVRFTQDSVKASFRDGTSINEVAAALRAGGAEAASKFPPIRLVEHGGQLFSLDNRRLLAFSQAGQRVPFRMATDVEIMREWSSKFTTTGAQGWGQFITVRP